MAADMKCRSFFPPPRLWKEVSRFQSLYNEEPIKHYNLIMPVTADSQDFLSLQLTHITQITMVYQTVQEDGDYTTIDTR